MFWRGLLRTCVKVPPITMLGPIAASAETRPLTFGFQPLATPVSGSSAAT